MTESASLDRLTATLDAWRGDPDEAARLREAVRALPALPRPGGEAERAIAMAQAAYAGRAPFPGAERLARRPDLARWLGPFLGDPALGPWPFDAPLTIPDQEAVAWLAVLAEHGLVDERVRRFVNVLFRVRRRDVWVPASRALARLALRDAGLRSTLAAAWSAAFPGVRGRPAPSRLAVGQDRHAARHVLHAACAWLAAGGAPEVVGGLTAGDVAGRALPSGDRADASVVLLGLAELAGGPATLPAILAGLPARAEETPPDEQCEAALRDLADRLAGAPSAAGARQAIERRLLSPRFAEARGVERIDALWSLAATARWLAAQGRQADVARLVAGAPDVRLLIELRAGEAAWNGEAQLVDLALARLPALLDADVRATMPEGRWALAVAELLALLDRSELSQVPWPSLVRRAAGAAPAARARPGTVGEVAFEEVVRTLGAEGHAPACALRGRILSPAAVAALARSPSGFVARQVAVQSEQALRALPPAEQVRGLWALLSGAPNPELLPELAEVLRGEAGEPVALRRLIEAAAALQASPGAAAYRALTEVAVEVLAAPHGGEPHLALARAAQASRAAAEVLEANVDALGAERLAEALRAWTAGPQGDGGVGPWLAWLGVEWAAVRLAGDRLIAGLRDRPEPDRPDEPECQALDQACQGLREAIAPLPFPEGRPGLALCERVEAWVARRRADAARATLLGSQVDVILAAADEDAAVRLATSPEAALLPSPAGERLGRYLVDQLRFSAAGALRARLGRRVRLPTPLQRLTPLLATIGAASIAALGSPLLGKLLGAGVRSQAAFIAFTVGFGFLILAGDLSSRMARRGGDSTPQHVGRVIRRTLPLYLAALAGTAACVSVLSLLVHGHLVRSPPLPPLPAEVAIWSSVAVFLGIVLERLAALRRKD